MKHFVCRGGCQGVADKEGNCQTLDCKNFGMPLVECTCEDGTHGLEESSQDSEKE